jgi:epoxyqueuosine reductase
MLQASSIKQRALDLGFDLVGIASPSAAKDLAFLPQWIKLGYGGEMRYLANPKREDPRRILPSVKSILCVGLIYNTPYPYSTEVVGISHREEDSSTHTLSNDDAPSRGWISRYAWGKDYHKIMRSKLEQLRAAVEKMAAGVETCVFVDTGPVMERAFARLSGIGWMGKNTCLINQEKGSWLFLGVILTSLELDLDLPAPDRCGSCTKCIEACPTNALAEPYVMDASRCIAYLNIELRGAIPEEFRPAIGQNIFGCDICQDVCPWNKRPLSVVSGQSSVVSDESAEVRSPLPVGGSQWPPAPSQLPSLDSREDFSKIDSTQRQAATTVLAEFQPMRIKIEPVGPAEDSAYEDATTQLPPAKNFSLFNPTLEELALMTEEDFKRVFAKSPIKRTKYRGWRRNLCVVMGNSGDRRFIPWLEAVAADADAVVGEHAAWALRRLQGGVSK